MAILPRQKSFGEMLGTGLGGGLSTGMQMLAQTKLKKLSDAQNVEKMNTLVNRILGGSQPGGVQPQVQPEFGLNQPALQGSLGVQPQPQGQQEGLLGQMSDIEKASLAASVATGSPASVAASFRGFAKERNRAKIAEDRLKFDTENKAWEFHKDFLEKSNEDVAFATDVLQTTSSIRELVGKGNLPHPMLAGLVDKFGKIIGMENPAALLGGDAEALQAFSKNFIKHVRTIFGAKPAAGLVKMYAKTFATLGNTDEGKMLLADISDLTAKGSLAMGDSIEEVVAENKGVPPRNLPALARRKAKIKKDEYLKELNQKLRTVGEYGQKLQKAQKNQKKLVGRPLDPSKLGLAEGARIELADGTVGRVVNNKFVPEDENGNQSEF